MANLEPPSKCPTLPADNGTARPPKEISLYIAGITSALGCLGGAGSGCCQPSPSMNCGFRPTCSFSQSSYTLSYAFPQPNYGRYGQNGYLPRSQQESIIAPVGGFDTPPGLGPTTFHEPRHLPQFNSPSGLDIYNPPRSWYSVPQINHVPGTLLNNPHRGQFLDTSYARTSINDISAASYPVAQRRENSALSPYADPFTNVDQLLGRSRAESEIERVKGFSQENQQASEASKVSYESSPINELAPSRPFNGILANRTGVVPTTLLNVSSAINDISSMPQPSFSGSYSTAQSTKPSSQANTFDIAWHTGSKEPQASMERIPKELRQSLYEDISPTEAFSSSFINQRKNPPNRKAKAALQIQRAPIFSHKTIKKTHT